MRVIEPKSSKPFFFSKPLRNFLDVSNGKIKIALPSIIVYGEKMYTAKRKIIVAAVVSLMCFYVFVPSILAQDASLNVEPSSATIDIDDELTVNITVSDWLDTTPGMFSYQMVLQFDTDYLEATSAEIPDGHFLTPTSGVPPGIFIVQPGLINNTLGTVSFAATLLAPEEAKTGDGVIGTVTFLGVAEGVASLTLEGVVLADANAQPIPEENYSINDGEITVIPEFSTVAMILLLLAFTGVILFLKKKDLLVPKI